MKFCLNQGDSCKYYWPNDWPLLWKWVLWSMREAFLTSSLLLYQRARGEEGICPCSILSQHLEELGTQQSCWSESLDSMCWQHQSHRPWFCWQYCTFSKINGGPGHGSQSVPIKSKVTGTSCLQDQNQGQVIWKLAGWHISVCSCMQWGRWGHRIFYIPV